MKALIADDHSLFRAGVRQLLAQEFASLEVVEASNLDEAGELLAQEEPPDLLLMDLNMPGVDGVDSIVALGDAAPGAKIVILSASEGRLEVGDALAAGVNGYIPKSLGAQAIISALKSVIDGGVYVPVSITRRTGAGSFAGKQRGKSLKFTERQRHVMPHLMLGKSSKEIARSLDIAEGTVKIHLASIYRILGVKCRADAILKLKEMEV